MTINNYCCNDNNDNTNSYRNCYHTNNNDNNKNSNDNNKNSNDNNNKNNNKNSNYNSNNSSDDKKNDNGHSIDNIFRKMKKVLKSEYLRIIEKMRSPSKLNVHTQVHNSTSK